MGVVLLVALLAAVVGCFVASFFLRRHRESHGPQQGWRATDELFHDPSTNRVMRVWLDQAGERRYVEEAGRPSV